MNYLAHAFLSFGDGGIVTGNMIADHIKGRAALEQFPEAIKKGILLHRKIDEYTDLHPATQRAKLPFRETYGLYAGPVMDTLYDHFLANDPKLFAGEAALLSFTQDTYGHLQEHEQYFPERFATYFPHMKQDNWLYNYRSFKGIERSLKGLSRRAKHMAPIDKAYKLFIANYYLLNQCYFELMDDIVRFTKSELSK